MKKGIKLIELIVVILILSILMLLIFPNFINLKRSAEEEIALSNLRTIQTAVDEYYIENNKDYPTDDGELPIEGETKIIDWDKLDEDYLKEDPQNLDNYDYFLDDVGTVITSRKSSYISTFYETFGGSSTESFLGVEKTLDGGFVAVGYSYSDDGDVMENKGDRDFIIGKFTSTGKKIWIDSFGGSSSDVFSSVIRSNDGGYISAGNSDSSDGNLTSNKGWSDFIISKFTSNGNINWVKNYGGSDDDYLNEVIKTNDGGYISVGTTYSTDGDISLNNGMTDAVIFKVDSEGNLIWLKTLGDEEDDEFTSVIELNSGDYIATGYTISLTDYSLDFLLTKVDKNGNIVWSKTYGGSNDDSFSGVIETNDEGLIAIGKSSSNNGDLQGNNGMEDGVIGKFDKDGSLVWIKNYGGEGIDSFLDIKKETIDKIIITGEVDSLFGDFDIGTGETGPVLLEADYDGTITGINYFGENTSDKVISTTKLNDGGYITVGDTLYNSSFERFLAIKTKKQDMIEIEVKKEGKTQEETPSSPFVEIPFSYEQGTIKLNPDDEDDGIASLNLGFDIDIKGEIYSSLSIDTNGRIGLSIISSDYSNSSLSTVSDEIIAPYWTDLAFDSSTIADAGLYYKEGFEDGRDYVVIEYRNVFDYDTDWIVGEEGNFAVKIYDDGDIEFMYKDVYFNSSELNGNDATIGVNLFEGFTFNDYEYSYQDETLRSGFTILFSPK